MPTKLKTKGKRSHGSVRAKVGLPAKAGHRKAPVCKGSHITTPEDRAHGRFLASLGLTKPTTYPILQQKAYNVKYSKAISTV